MEVSLELSVLCFKEGIPSSETSWGGKRSRMDLACSSSYSDGRGVPVSLSLCQCWSRDRSQERNRVRVSDLDRSCNQDQDRGRSGSDAASTGIGFDCQVGQAANPATPPSSSQTVQLIRVGGFYTY